MLVGTDDRRAGHYARHQKVPAESDVESGNATADKTKRGRSQRRPKPRKAEQRNKKITGMTGRDPWMCTIMYYLEPARLMRDCGSPCVDKHSGVIGRRINASQPRARVERGSSKESMQCMQALPPSSFLNFSDIFPPVYPFLAFCLSGRP
jgi:hypothetical protein